MTFSRRDFVRTTSAGAAAIVLPDWRHWAPFPRLAKAALAARPFDLHQVRLRPGIFRDAMLVNRKYMMDLVPNRLLWSFRTTAGLTAPGEPYYGWEAPDNELRGHFVGHYLSGCALLAAQLGDDEVKARGNALVSELARCQQANGNGYLSAFPVELFDRLKARRGVWAPFYTLHKTMAGMYDSYALSGNAQALDVLRGMAQWVKGWADGVDDAQMQRVLAVEYGGMNEVLYDLSAATGDTQWRDLAHRFDHERVFAPLAEGRDELTKVHSNTTIPKVIGAARRYELTGEQRYHDIADYFWREVTGQRSYCTGGSSSGELYEGAPGDLSKTLNNETQESCVVYNMLKLSRQLFGWSADPRFADYYERALYNGMLGTQHPADGEKVYYTPLATGYWRIFGTPDHGFWCCHGSGVESHSKFGDSIYFHDDRGIFVNLYIASELDWRERGFRLTQDTTFPASDSVRLTIEAAPATPLAVRLRIPAWTKNATVKVNGRAVSAKVIPGEYLALEQGWKKGDRIELVLPMALRAEPIPGDATQQAVMYGPLVLAGRLGHDAMRAEPTRPRMSPEYHGPALSAPDIAAQGGDVVGAVEPVPGKALEFRTKGQTTTTSLAPLYRMIDERYVVYWKIV